VNRVDELLGRPVSMRSLCLLRIAVGPIVLLHLWPFLDDARHGVIYRDTFYEPYVSWYPELPRSLYLGLLWLGVVAVLAMMLGVVTRVATAAVFGIVTYNMFLSTTNFHNNRAFLVVVLGVLACAPCDRELSIDAWWRRRHGSAALPNEAPGWPLWLLRFEASVVYGASGTSKLLDRDWWGGNVTWDRVVHGEAHLRAHTILPNWFIDMLVDRNFHTYAAKVLVCTELFIAFGLWSRRTRYAAIWIAVVFHVVIEVTSSVEIFSYLAIAALVIWAVPSTRDRVLVVAPGDRFGSFVRRFDWLARFRIEDGDERRVVDRDGRVRRGRAATVFVLSRLPLTAWPALPALLFVRETRADERHRTTARATHAG
jgi:uncharacterized membrane protein YphA (DoxX/SURF4 family)